ncbi:MAG: LacI family DNA-binding transcriptional regulator [Ruminococcaceae bacterium]|nr:LacI family DNA-binding transcriptional regulator [Oscillospiraceae bacterium]
MTETEIKINTNKKATIYDVANALGVSVRTVHRALYNQPRIAPDTKKKVLEMAERMNFKVNRAAQSLKKKTTYLSFIINCPVEEHWKEIKRGIDVTLEELETYNLSSQFFFPKADEQNDFEKQVLDQIDACMEYTSGLVILIPGKSEKITNKLKEAQQKGICVASMISEIWDIDNIISVNADGRCAGSLAAELLHMICKKKNIGILIGSMGTKIHNDNIQGFNTFAQNDSFNCVNIYEHHDDPRLVVREARRMMEEMPDIDGVYMATSSAPIACGEIEKYGKQINIVTTDLTEEIRLLLKKRKITATIFQDPYMQGRKIVIELYKMIYEQKKAERYLVTPQLIFYSNSNMYSKDND